MKIEKYGDGKRCTEVLRRLLLLDERGEIPCGLNRVILLPIPSARDKIHITGTDRLLCEALCDVGRGCLIAGYGIPTELRDRAQERGAFVFDALLCEDFLTENSRISAIGALGYILTELGRVPADLTFGIVGYGRIGKELARMLMFLGGRVKIYTSKKLTRIELGKCGVETVYTDYKEGLPLSGIDVLINTAPTDLVTSFPENKIPDGMRVLELASGENFGDIEGIIRLPGIPDKMYAASAADAYFTAIEKYIKEVF